MGPTHEGVRSGDETAALALLVRLARQAAGRRYPPPHGFTSWDADALLDLISDAFARKGDFLATAITATTTDAALEVFLLRTLHNVLRDRGRESVRGKLIERLKTIFEPEVDFVRHVTPYDAWRLVSSPAAAWQGDLEYLIAEAQKLRGLAVTRWNTSGPTPASTRSAVVRVARAALDAASGFVRDGDVAKIVQATVLAVPGDESQEELHADVAVVAEHVTLELAASIDPADIASVAAAVWGALSDDERFALPHLASSRAVSQALGVGRRVGDAVAASAREIIRRGTLPGYEAAVLDALLKLAVLDDGRSTND